MPRSPDSSGALDPADSDALVVHGLERLEDGGEEELEAYLVTLGSQGSSVRRRILALGRSGMLHPPSGDRLRLPERLGNYHLEDRLGVGGMGMVFRATEEPSGDVCAIKLIRPEYRVYQTSRLRFQREIEAASRLSHPSIVRVRDFGEQDGLLYYAMEFVPGVNLGDLCAQWKGHPAGKLNGRTLWESLQGHAVCSGEPGDGAHRLFAGSWPEACLGIAAEVGDALAHAHEQGVLHRDVKPSNILLTPTGRVVLVDFGLASLQGEGSLTRSGSRLGSLPYMPPESLEGQGHVAGAYTDTYGLGVTLYELLALERAFPADSALGLERQIQQARPRPLVRANPAISRDTETLVLKAMDREPRRRYLSALALAQDARHILRGEAIHARRPGYAARLLRWLQDNPRPTALTGGFLVLILSGALLFAAMQRRAQQRTSQANERLVGEQERVERNLQAALESITAQMRLIRDPKLYRVEFQGLRESLAASITDFLDQLLTVEGQSSEYRQTRASAQFFIGTMELELGRTLSAHRRFQDCLTLRDGLLEELIGTGDAAGILHAQGNVAWTCQRLGVAAAYLGLHDVAQDACARLEQSLAELNRGRPMLDGAKIMAGQLVWTRGLIALDQGDLTTARLELEATREWEERWLRELPREASTLVGMANTDLYFVELELQRGALDQALALVQEGLGRIQKAIELEPEMTMAQIEGARLATLQGEILSRLGREQEALDSLDKALNWALAWQAYTGDVPRILPELARCRIAHAEVFRNLGQGEESEQAAQEALGYIQGLLEGNVKHGREQGELVSILRRGAELAGGEAAAQLLAQGQSRLAEALAFAPESGLLKAEAELLKAQNTSRSR